jgi:hypothetical protein
MQLAAFNNNDFPLGHASSLVGGRKTVTGFAQTGPT